jgi:hypothetical protein
LALDLSLLPQFVHGTLHQPFPKPLNDIALSTIANGLLQILWKSLMIVVDGAEGAEVRKQASPSRLAQEDGRMSG